jgi:hypothetical protein
VSRLSPQTLQRLDALFSPEDRAEAARLLIEECGNNLPLLQNLNEHRLERFRFAALKLSDGDLNELRKAIALAKVDWRDPLMSAGIGNDATRHKRWWPRKRVRKDVRRSE